MDTTVLFSLKPYVLVAYAFFGLSCLFMASLPRQITVPAAHASLRGLSIGNLLFISAAVFLLLFYCRVGANLLLGATGIAATLLLSPPRAWRTLDALFAGLSAAIIVLSLVWWQIGSSKAMPLPLGLFTILIASISIGLRDPGSSCKRLLWLPVSLFIVAGLAMLIDFGLFDVSQGMLVTLVHHWGAFIGSVLHMKAGLVPLYDIPLQYGLGPTLAITATCGGSDCWTGAEFLFAGFHLAQAVIFLSMALTTQARRGWPWICSVTIIMFAAAFLWPGYPTEGNTLMAMPSSGGIRFLPVTLVASFWFFGRPKAALALMIPALLWSPESAAMTLAVSGICGTSYFGFRKSAVITASMFVGCYAALFFIHRYIYGIWIDPAALIEYVLHVPGPLPIDPASDIVLLAATLGLGGWLIYNKSEGIEAQRRDLVVTALLFAATSYSLGRSHPNNVCNLAPLLALVALRGLDRSITTMGAIGNAVTIGLSASVAALALSPNNPFPFHSHIVTDVHAVIAHFPEQEPDIVRLRAQIPSTPALGIADFGPYFARHPAETIVWTPMDPSSLWTFVPSSRRRVYIERSARRLRRSGWAIFADYELFMLDDLKVAYVVRDESSSVGLPSHPGGPATHYTMACFDPKPEIAAAIDGPPCPSNVGGILKSAQAPSGTQLPLHGVNLQAQR